MEPTVREPLLVVERRAPPRAVGPAPSIARVLVGQGPCAREARIEFRGGALGGASIHLVSGADGLEVRLGASSDPARQALAQLIDRVGLHLRSRGIVVRAGQGLQTGTKDRGRGGDAQAGR
jgi:hypothetical protein